METRTVEESQLDNLNGNIVARFEIEQDGKRLPFEVRKKTSEEYGVKEIHFTIINGNIPVGASSGFLEGSEEIPNYHADVTVKEPLTIAQRIPYFMARSIAEIILQSSPPLTWSSSKALSLKARGMYSYLVSENQNPDSPYYQKFNISTNPDDSGKIRQYIIEKN